MSAEPDRLSTSEPANIAAAECLAELITSSWISHAIGAGIELGVFDALAEAPTRAEELALQLGCAPPALAQLLRAYESIQLCLLDAEGRSAVTPMLGAIVSRRPESSLIVPSCFATRRGSRSGSTRLWTATPMRLRRPATAESVDRLSKKFGSAVLATASIDPADDWPMRSLGYE